MINTLIRGALAGLLLVAAPAGLHAESFSIGDITVETPWTRETPGGARVAGGYLRIVNRGTEPDRLIGGTIEIAERFEVHSMEMRDGVARMAPVTGGLLIPPGESVELAPGGYHVMFTGLTHPPREGETVAGTLIFERAATLEIQYAVGGIGARTPPGAAGHDHGSDDEEHEHELEHGHGHGHGATGGHRH
jgi:periplasmic copper chaperone A